MSSPIWPRPPRGTRTALLVNARRALRRAEANAAQLAEAGVHDGGRGTAWSTGPRRQRPVEPAGGDHADHRADPATDHRDHPDGATPGGQSARPRRPADRQARLGKPVEFGYKGQVVDNDDGIVVDHDVHAGNPTDATQLAPAIQRAKARTGGTPPTVTADRGYGKAAIDTALTDLGVRTVVIPPKGRPGAARQQVEKRRTFRRTINWRTGCEGRISTSNADTAGTAPAWTASKERKPGADKGSSPTT